MTPIKLSELELHAEAVKKTEWCDCGDDPRNQNRLTGEVNHDQSCKNRRSNALTISRLCEAIRIAHVALEFYKGNFDGRQGTKWNSDIFYYEDNCGYTTTQDESTAKEALTKINSLVDLS